MSFPHKRHKRFYSDYSQKQQTPVTEDSINLMGKRLKKELDDIYNRFQVINGNLAIEWHISEEYEVGEIVSFNNLNFECKLQNIGKEPQSEKNFWKEVTISDYSSKPLDNYLSKYNQDVYLPQELQPNEKTTDYHPATKKYVDDELNYAFFNRTVENANKLDGKDSTFFATQEQITNIKETFVRIDNIVNNLNSNDSKKPLSAQQGKALKVMIDKINTLLTSNDTNLDEIQEIVNFIKKNREKLDTLGIDGVNGLRTELNNLKNNADSRVPKDWWNSEKFIERIKQVDGPNSGLDADLLDGKDSSYFMPASQYNSLDILNKLKESDGSGSGLDADLLDGLNSTSFLRRDANDFPQSDNTYTLGKSTHRWREIHSTDFIGTALKAKYADLSEIYECKNFNDFECGDVIGINDCGEFVKYNKNTKLIGIITTNPAVILNNEISGINIALKGQVPCKTLQNIKAGQYILADCDNPGFCIAKDDYTFEESKRLLGCSISNSEDGKVLIKV